MSSQDFLNIEQLDDGVLHLELKNAPVNALTARSLRGLGNLFQELGSDSNVAVVLLSSGLKVFSAGLNLKEAQNFDIKEQSDIVDAFHQCFLELYGFPKPLICAVEGAAIAGGLFPVLCSDYRIAGAKAAFGLAEVRVGVGFPVGLVEIVRAEVRQNTMRRMVQNGKPIDVEAAKEAGIIDEQVPHGEALEQAMKIALDYARLPPIAYKTVKHQVRMPVMNALAREVEKASLRTAPQAWFTEETTKAMAKMIG